MQESQFHNFLRKLMLPLEEIDKLLPKKGKIIDLGCGEGVIAKYLATTSTRLIIGVDYNQNRLTDSNLINLKFESEDIRNYKFKNVDGIIISDVLHHLNLKDQKGILSRISKSLKKGGRLLIKEIDTREFFRSHLSRFWDFVFYPQDKIYYWNSQDLKNYLEKLNFSVKILRPIRFFPGSTTLFICTK